MNNNLKRTIIIALAAAGTFVLGCWWEHHLGKKALTRATTNAALARKLDDTALRAAKRLRYGQIQDWERALRLGGVSESEIAWRKAPLLERWVRADCGLDEGGEQ